MLAVAPSHHVGAASCGEALRPATEYREVELSPAVFHAGIDVSAVAETEIGNVRTVQAPDRKLEVAGRHDGLKSGRRVSVSMVAWSTLAMAAATGLGALPFFFLELEAQWAGLCNGLAAGVMLAASFDLVQEGQMVFAAGCMHDMDSYAEVLPDAFKEAAPSQVASAGTLAVAFMETLGTVLQGFTDGHNSEDTAAFWYHSYLDLVHFLEELFRRILSYFQHATHFDWVASGIAFRLAAWRPLQLLMSSKMGLFTTSFLLIGGSLIYHVATSNILRVVNRKKSSVNVITSSSGLSLSVLTLQSLLACGSVFLHAYAEGLQLGVAARKAYGLGRYMVLPVSLHGLPRGAAVASCMYGATDSWRAALAAAAFTGFAGPSAAISAILAKIDYSGLDYWMVIACGVDSKLWPCFQTIAAVGHAEEHPGASDRFLLCFCMLDVNQELWSSPVNHTTIVVGMLPTFTEKGGVQFDGSFSTSWYHFCKVIVRSAILIV
ncbi:hypothetical protein GUJ93_ZPchr1105g33316 [Zizania palustris]|uniref:Uncharacterized protein n=1 Tax=Zizania palustris TaxID=103762 RepID=A0A8J5V7S8_ZIZPA|nr:hypothetical protein GUJ93_ZPchr1105g33316 [Zizania palustris]